MLNCKECAKGGVMSVDSGKNGKRKDKDKSVGITRPPVRAKSAAERFSKWIYVSLETGLIGALFTSYKSGDEKRTPGVRGRRGALSSAADAISDAINSGCVVHALKRASENLLSIRLKVIGTFFAAFGIYTVLYASLVNFLVSGTREIFDIFAGVLFTVISFPLIFSDDTLIGALRSSVLGKILADIGLDTDGIRDPKPFGKLNFGFIAGVAAGLLSYFSSPFRVAFFILLMALMWIIASKPEIGVVTTAFILPFVSTRVLILLLAVTSLSFIVKIVRGKRYATFETLDASAFGMLLVILLGGIVSVSSDSYKDSILYSILIISYFLAANLLKSKVWLERMCAAFVSGAAVLSAVYTVCYAADLAISGVSDAVSGLFENSIASMALSGDVPALRLVTVAVLPMAVSMLLRPSFGSGKNRYVWTAVAALVSPMIIAPSSYTILALTVALILLMFIYTRNSVLFVIGSGIGIGAIYAVFPSVFEKIGAYFDTGVDRFFESRVSLWHDVRILVPGNLFGGIGFGGGSFSSLFETSLYTEAPKHVYNTYLQLWIETGIVGLVMFVVFIGLLVSAVFTLVSQIGRASKHPAQRSRGWEAIGGNLMKDREQVRRFSSTRFSAARKVSAAAPFCGVIGLLVAGLFDYIWYDERIFLFFWLAAGLCAAELRSTRREIRDMEFSYRSESEQTDSYEVDLNI